MFVCAQVYVSISELGFLLFFGPKLLLVVLVLVAISKVNLIVVGPWGPREQASGVLE